MKREKIAKLEHKYDFGDHVKVQTNKSKNIVRICIVAGIIFNVSTGEPTYLCHSDDGLGTDFYFKQIKESSILEKVDHL